jgi:hypothetical protein
MAQDYEVKAQTVEPPQPSRTAQLINRLDVTLESVQKAASHLREIADRHLGTAPSADGKTVGGPVGVPNGSLAQANDKLDMIGNSLDYLIDQIRRLDNI